MTVVGDHFWKALKHEGHRRAESSKKHNDSLRNIWFALVMESLGVGRQEGVHSRFLQKENQMLPQSTPPTRGRVLEEAFFYRADRELSEVLSKRVQREEKIRLFANATGIRDQKHLERLADSGFELSTLHFVWVPLILVAWADGNAEKLEKKAIADILASKGISQETISRVIAHDWFRKKPTEELWEIWAEFSAATSTSLNPSVYNELIDEIVRLCRLIADASGGFMGLGKISAAETQAIDRVIRTLQQTDGDRAHASSSSAAAQAVTSDRSGVVDLCLAQEPT